MKMDIFYHFALFAMTSQSASPLEERRAYSNQSMPDQGLLLAERMSRTASILCLSIFTLQGYSYEAQAATMRGAVNLSSASKHVANHHPGRFGTF
jgi:hypothetical protein